MDSTIDYLSYILFRYLGPLVRILPIGLCFYLGRRLGDALYYFDLKHKQIAYSNIKIAFGGKMSAAMITKLTRAFYRNFGESLLEVFLIPSVNKEYIEKYITIEGLQYVGEAFKKGKGVIVLGVHAGSWELSNIIAANLGFPFSIFVRNQKFPRLNKLLNSYRQEKGCKIIERRSLTRGLVACLKNNEAVGMTADQGGRKGAQVNFFGKSASMATGAVRLALKYDSVILPGFYTRLHGPYIKAIVEAPFLLKRTGDLKKDISSNLQAITTLFERYIEKYSKDYLWSYKIWKYSSEKKILILNDSRTGHLRQSQAVAKLINNGLEEKGIRPSIDTVEVQFKNSLVYKAFALSSILSGKYRCQGCLFCLKSFLKQGAYESLMAKPADIIISCGSRLAPVNFVLSRENSAKSITVLRPGLLSAKRFDLVIMPRHDSPTKRKNVAITEGSLNLIDEEYLREQSDKLLRSTKYDVRCTEFCIGLLIGGNTKKFSLRKEAASEVIRQIKSAAEKLNADILVTTSRRTPVEIEDLVKEEFKDYSRCKLLVIANEKNVPEAVGGILGLSKAVVVSPESISMISEALNSRKYTFVFSSSGLDNRHIRFLENFTKNGFIYLVKPEELSRSIEGVWQNKPTVKTTRDNLVVGEAIKRIL